MEKRKQTTLVGIILTHIGIRVSKQESYNWIDFAKIAVLICLLISPIVQSSFSSNYFKEIKMKLNYFSIFATTIAFIFSGQVNSQPSADFTNIPIKLKVVKRSVPIIDFDGQYMRFVIMLPKQSKDLSLTPDQIEYKEKLKIWLKKYLIGDETKSVLISANAIIDGTRLPEQAIYYQIKNSDGLADQYYAVSPLTPFAAASNTPILLEIHGKYKNDVSSNLASTVITALSIASEIVSAPAPILSKASKGQFDEAAKKVDKAICDIFGTSKNDLISFSFDPSTDERVELSVDTSPEPIATILIDLRESVISSSGKKINFPVNRDDITKFIPYGSDKPKTLAEIARSLPTYPPLATATTSTPILSFCAEFNENLAKYGLNKYDRAAALFSYLQYSKWNYDDDWRSPPPPLDECESRTDVLANTNLKGLRTWDQVISQPPLKKPAVDQLFNIRIQNPLDEVLLGKNDFRDKHWALLVTSPVHISSSVTIKLGEGTLLQPGAGMDVDPLSLSNLLSESAISRDNKVSLVDCYTPYVTTTRNGRFRSKKSCTSVVLEDGSWAPTEIEFEYSAPFYYENLKKADGAQLTQIRLFVSPKPANKVVQQ
ncbi:hypothetical protein GTP91_24400 [Rugamonas sp. FT82W]|uniref:Uncharacterized protein n=1 Tax=Duganella vulcania TaxID=2692166 RepID=A0A845G9P0_9BURK|nr:hypothetical protein [Duganella vulcania]MYM90300.1 hypothetical protein [Duganella vulcania]